MKILQLCKKFPFPLKDGESIAVTYLSRALVEQDCEIILLSMNTSKHYVDLDSLPANFSHYKAVHTVDIDNAVKPVSAFFNLFSQKSYHVSRLESDEFAQKLTELLVAEKFDIVLMETAFLAEYLEVIRDNSDAKIVMRAHNVEHEIWDRASINTGFSLKKWYLRHSAKKLKNFELNMLNMLNTYDFLVPISDIDLTKFRRLGYANGAYAMPIGLDLSEYEPANQNFDKPLSMAFIGSLLWLPNFEGIKWFVQRILPVIKSRFPNIPLHIAGRTKSELSSQLQGGNVFIHGEVKDARRFLNQHQILIVPLRSGSGMRVKILEGMALGQIIITTTIGLEGIDAIPGKHILVADTAEEFLEAIAYCYNNPGALQEISQNAKCFVEEGFDHNSVARKFKKVLVEYLYKTDVDIIESH